MEIRKYLALFIAMHVTLICYSQTRIQSRDVKRIAGKAYLLSNGDQFEIRESVILAKLKAGKKHVKDGIKVIKSHSFGMLEIAVPDGVAVEEYRCTLEKTGEFESVEFDTYIRSCMSPNDSCYVNNQQWGLGHIDVDKAWEITTGSSSVKIAVIDKDGFELDHPDLDYGNDTYSNLNGSDGIDYVNPYDFTPTGKHGTMVAGIISAKTNNGVGIAGIAGGNNCEGSKIIPYHATNLSQCYDVVYDAVAKGVKVINMSFYASYNYLFDQALNYAYNNGVTVVCASGNQPSSQIEYPASHEHTIAVGAIDSLNNRLASSNYGSGLDLVAPGVGIRSTSLNHGYDLDDGTSYAAPHVSGVVALMLSVNPNLRPSEIRNILHESTIRIKWGIYNYNTSGWSPEVGYGLLNACRAVVSALNISGPSFICGSSTATYSISNLPSSYTVNWVVDNSDFNITTSGNQCSVTYTGTGQYDGVNLSANIYYNNNFIKQFTQSITYGTPLIAGDLVITGGDGSHLHWTSNIGGNTVDIEEVCNIPLNYSQFEGYLYRLSPITFEPEATPIRHWNSFGVHEVVDYLTPGWYLLMVRGINNCGVSEDLGAEIECVDTDMLRANGNGTELALMYNRLGQVLTVSVNHADHSITNNAYTIQLWNETNMVRELRLKDSTVQIPMAGLKNGLYTIRYVNNDEVIAKKFMK